MAHVQECCCARRADEAAAGCRLSAAVEKGEKRRGAAATQADVDLLNTRVVTQLDSRDTCVVRKNKLRHAINRLQMERFARSRRQKIFIFPARHTRRRKRRKAGGSRDLDIDKLLEVQDSSDVKAPGLLLYTQDMPMAVLSNISTHLGIVNGALGRATGIVPDRDGMFRILLKREAILTAGSQILPHGFPVRIVHSPASLCTV
jgi:hypothetical protein